MIVAARTKGRPTVFSRETVHKLEQAFAMDCTVQEACRISGVSRSAYYKHLEVDEDFMDKMERAKMYVTIQARHAVAQAIRNGDVKMSQWYLERKRKSEFSIRPQPNMPIQDRFDTLTSSDILQLLDVS